MESIIHCAKQAALNAALLLDERSIGDIRVKSDRSLVTDIDAAVEESIVNTIKTRYPTHGILGEEGTSIQGSSEYLWIIDPIDGTHNYIRQIPLYGIAIGIAFKDEFIGGVFYLPAEKILYYAEKGSGAFRNDTPMHVSVKTQLAESTLSFDSCIREDTKLKSEAFAAVGCKAFNVRMFGSSSVALSYLSEGRIDASIEFDDKLWDFAAGVTLIQEAGGMVTDFKAKPVTTKTVGYAASNGRIHKELIEEMRRFT
jgi:myo-inositol-1(or 4)-monophosphatase